MTAAARATNPTTMNASDIPPFTVTPFRPWPEGHLCVLLCFFRRVSAAAATERGFSSSLGDCLCRRSQHLAAVRLRLDHVLIKQTGPDWSEPVQKLPVWRRAHSLWQACGTSV